MHEPFALTRLLNYLFGGIVNSIMQMVGIHRAHHRGASHPVARQARTRPAHSRDDLGFYRESERYDHRARMAEVPGLRHLHFSVYPDRQSQRPDSWNRGTDDVPDRAARSGPPDLRLLQLPGIPREWDRLFEAVCRPDLVDVVADDPDRNHLSFRPDPVAHHSSL